MWVTEGDKEFQQTENTNFTLCINSVGNFMQVLFSFANNFFLFKVFDNMTILDNYKYAVLLRRVLCPG